MAHLVRGIKAKEDSLLYRAMEECSAPTTGRQPKQWTSSSMAMTPATHALWGCQPSLHGAHIVQGLPRSHKAWIFSPTTSSQSQTQPDPGAKCIRPLPPLTLQPRPLHTLRLDPPRLIPPAVTSPAAPLGWGLRPCPLPPHPPPPPCPGPGLHRAARPRAGPLPSPSPPRRRGARRAAGPLASPPPPATRWSTRTGPWRARSPFPCLAAAGRAGRSRRSPPAAAGRAGPIPGRAAPSSGGLRSGRHLPVASRPNARPAHQPAPPSRSPLASSSPAAGPIREALCGG